MKRNNYYVVAFENAVKAGESVEALSKNLEKMADEARLRGAWPIWNQINEAMMILGI